MATQQGYETENLTFAQRNPQTIMLSYGVRIRKTDTGYAIETLGSDNATWTALSSGSIADGQIAFGDGTDIGGSSKLKCNDTAGSLTIQGIMKLTPQADPPGTPTEGMIYADTDHTLNYYNGTTWKVIAFV